MNEQIKNHLSEVLDRLTRGTDLVIDQAPLLLQEIITYAIVTHSIFLVGLSVLIGLSLWFSINMLRDENFCKKITAPKDRGVVCDVCFGLFLLGTFCWVYHLIHLVQSVVAPRMYLLEYISEMIRKM